MSILYILLILIYFAVYFMQAIFDRSADTAVLVSPVYNYNQPICLKFYYQISTPKISLGVFASTTKSQFASVGSWTYSSQKNVGSWNNASYLLKDGLTQLRFVADKTGLTTDRHFVNIDRISLVPAGDCPQSGNNSMMQ